MGTNRGCAGKCEVQRKSYVALSATPKAMGLYTISQRFWRIDPLAMPNGAEGSFDEDPKPGAVRISAARTLGERTKQPPGFSADN